MGLFDSILGSIRMDDPVPGTAQIVAVSQCDADATWQNCGMSLVVQADGVPATPVEHEAMVNTSKWPSPGQQVPITVDRAHPNRLKIDWSGVEDSGTQAARAAEQLAAQMRGEAASAPTHLQTQPPGWGTQAPSFAGMPVSVINLSGHAPTEEQLAKLKMFGIDPGQIATTPPTAANAGTDVVDEISRLADLHTSGALTDEEFTKAKKHLLEGL